MLKNLQMSFFYGIFAYATQWIILSLIKHLKYLTKTI